MDKRPVTQEAEQELIRYIDWAREFLACEVEGQYTSDAALHLALAAMMQRPATIVRDTMP